VVEPPGPTMVIVYKVVCTGWTEMEPLVDTAPIPWSMEAEVALLVVQLRVEFCPASMVVGVALKATVGGATITVTVVVDVTVPLLPVAVIV